MDLFMRFPGGKSKALTLSYDDGVIQDIRLANILDAHGIKATFNLNSGLFSETYGEGRRRMSAEQVKELFANSEHEAALHSFTHAFLGNLPVYAAVADVTEDRRRLEELTGRIIRGMAYPNGSYNDELIEALKKIGIAYSRTVKSTHDFTIPTDWMRMPATCHHNDPMLNELAERFVREKPEDLYYRSSWLFYVWGHSYEFDEDDNWKVIENFAEKTGGKEDVWYAANIEVYDYIEAYHRLLFSMDCGIVYNPTVCTIWFEKDRKLYHVKPGETKRI